MRSEGLAGFRELADWNDHEMTFTIKSGSASASRLLPRGASARSVSRIPLEAFLYVPDLSGGQGSQAALGEADLGAYDKFGVGCVPDLEDDDFPFYEIRLNDGSTTIVDAMIPPDFPCIIVGRAQDDVASVGSLGSRASEVSIEMEYLRSYFTNKIDAWPFQQPELYCCTRPHGITSWRINDGSDPWGKVNESGKLYPIDREIFTHHEETLFDIAFRDMDGSTPDPDDVNGDGEYTDDDMGFFEGISTTALSSASIAIQTNDTIVDNNKYTTGTSQRTYFWLRR